MSSEESCAEGVGEANNRAHAFLLTHMDRDGDKVRMKLEERVGNELWVRPLDDGEQEPQGPIKVEIGDIVIPFTPLHSVGLNTSPIAGEGDGFLTSIPIVEIRRDDKSRVIWVRSLKPCEDPVERVRWTWGYEVKFDSGSIVVDIERIDRMFPPDADGYAPLANTIWTWMILQKAPGLESLFRYVLAAARRLDVAHRCFQRVRDEMDRMNKAIGAPEMRAAVFEIVGLIEITVVALSRAVDMAVNLHGLVSITTPIPSSLLRASGTLTELRNAYEHIEDRAQGQVRSKPHPHALTIFDWTSLLEEDAITYGEHRLELSEIPDLLLDTRRYLKEGGAEAEFNLYEAHSGTRTGEL
jgi:hypothetical protein